MGNCGRPVISAERLAAAAHQRRRADIGPTRTGVNCGDLFVSKKYHF
jgi:hypothetical protein